MPSSYQEDPALARTIDEAHPDAFWMELSELTVGQCLPAKAPKPVTVPADASLLESPSWWPTILPGDAFYCRPVWNLFAEADGKRCRAEAGDQHALTQFLRRSQQFGHGGIESVFQLRTLTDSQRDGFFGAVVHFVGPFVWGRCVFVPTKCSGSSASASRWRPWLACALISPAGQVLRI